MTDLATELVEVLRLDLARSRERVAALIREQEAVNFELEQAHARVARLVHENAWLQREVERLTREVNSLRGGN